MSSACSLGDLCRYILGYEQGRYAGDPVRLGDLFREYAGIERTPSLATTINLVGSLGIKVEAADYLRTGGTNMMAVGHWHIHYSAKDRPATQKFTICHELFEVIHKNIAALDTSYSLLTEPQLSRCADRFAASALIPPRYFPGKASATGCDLVKLGEDLELSHQCLLIALGQHFADIPFVGALYEYLLGAAMAAKPEVEDFVATVVVKTPRARRVRDLCGLQAVPARNSHPQVGSLVCAAVTGGRPVLWRGAHVEDSPVVLVRPLLSVGLEPYRVILLAVPSEEVGMISVQVEIVEPILVDGDVSCPSENKCRHSRSCIWSGNCEGGYDERGV